MAITLIVDDLKQPTGELMPSLFPGNDIDLLIAGWLQQASDEILFRGIADVDATQAAYAWVYYRAYEHVSIRLNAEFASRVISSGAGNATQSVTGDQRKFFADRSMYWFGFFNSYTAPTAVNAASIPFFFGRVNAGNDWWLP